MRKYGTITKKTSFKSNLKIDAKLGDFIVLPNAEPKFYNYQDAEHIFMARISGKEKRKLKKIYTEGKLL